MTDEVPREVPKGALGDAISHARTRHVEAVLKYVYFRTGTGIIRIFRDIGWIIVRQSFQSQFNYLGKTVNWLTSSGPFVLSRIEHQIRDAASQAGHSPTVAG